MTEIPAILTQEVELRVCLTPEEGRDLLRRLRDSASGAEDRGSRLIRDVYFCPHDVTRLEDVEMDAVGSYSLRLRREVRDGRETVLLNSKTITQPGDHQAWEEHEVQIDGFDEGYALLTRTAFKPFFDLTKTRHAFRLNNATLNIEDIEGFGFALEVEIMATPAGQDAAKDTIRDLLRSLDVSPDRVVDKSVTNLIMHKRARF